MIKIVYNIYMGTQFNQGEVIHMSMTTTKSDDNGEYTLVYNSSTGSESTRPGGQVDVEGD